MYIYSKLLQNTRLQLRIMALSRLLYSNSECSRGMFMKFKEILTFKSQNYFMHTSNACFKLHQDNDLLPTEKQTAARELFFRGLQKKDKETFLKIVKNFSSPDKVKRGHVEFIYAAMKCMQDFALTGDLEVYKKLMNVFPKGKMIPKNLIQAEFYHFPRQQECAVELLDQMEYYGICPDKEMGHLIQAIFGKSSHVFKKVARMLYWMPKLKNLNPYILPDPPPSDISELARFALKKMCVDVRTKIVEYDAKELEDSGDKTWIMSAQSPEQQRLINEHSVEKALYVEGPSIVWLRKLSVTYFVLRADSKSYPNVEFDDDDTSNLLNHMFGDPKPKQLTLAPSSVHEQEDGIIMAICCTGTSSKDSLLSWIRFLRQTNPKLDNIPVLFKIRSSPASLVSVNAEKNKEAQRTVDSDSEQQRTVDSDKDKKNYR